MSESPPSFEQRGIMNGVLENINTLPDWELDPIHAAISTTRELIEVFSILEDANVDLHAARSVPGVIVEMAVEAYAHRLRKLRRATGTNNSPLGLSSAEDGNEIFTFQHELLYGVVQNYFSKAREGRAAQHSASSVPNKLP